jgi:hypothetical protein
VHASRRRHAGPSGARSVSRVPPGVRSKARTSGGESHVWDGRHRASLPYAPASPNLGIGLGSDGVGRCPRVLGSGSADPSPTGRQAAVAARGSSSPAPTRLQSCTACPQPKSETSPVPTKASPALHHIGSSPARSAPADGVPRLQSCRLRRASCTFQRARRAAALQSSRGGRQRLRGGGLPTPALRFKRL